MPALRKNTVGRNIEYNSFSRPVFGFPDSIRCQLRYADIGTLVSTSGALGVQKYRANSTFDPDYTSTGHQPLYRDTYAAIYDHYAVINSLMRVEIWNTNASNSGIVGVGIDDDTTASTVLTTIMEQSHGTSEVITGLAGSHSRVVFTIPWNCQKVLRINPFTSETYKTAIGSNPDEESIFTIYFADTAAATSTVLYKVEIIYDVLFTELTTPTGS